jgi:hypothetical protein
VSIELPVNLAEVTLVKQVDLMQYGNENKDIISKRVYQKNQNQPNMSTRKIIG